MDEDQLKAEIDYHEVFYAKEAQPGIDYLKVHLNSEERRAFFDEAHAHSTAEFKDQNDHTYVLNYDSGSGHYTLTRR